MPGPPNPEGAPDTPPPEVPEEFAAAYSEAYRRALESSPYDVAADDLTPQEVVTVGTHSIRGEHPADFADRLRADRWGLPALLSGLALLLVIGAYGVGKLVSDDGSPDSTGTPATSETSSRPSDSPTVQETQQGKPSPDAYEGEVSPVSASKAKATCTARPSVDASGKRVRYVAGNTLDGDSETAWRCDGSGIGERLTFELPDDTELAEVGLIPGYAKTDPKSGADRYTENNRITRVRWTFGDGSSLVQKFDPDPDNRAMQTLRVPETETDEVTLEILEVRRGPRNTTAISEVAFGEAGG